MSNENFKPGSRAVVKTCAENSAEFAWGFRVGDVVIIQKSESLPHDVPSNALYVESARTGMIGFFTPDELSAE